MRILKKIVHTIVEQCRARGVYFAFLMNLSHLIAICRAIPFKILYFRNITCSIFSLQKNSRIELFNKNSKVSIGKFVFIRKNASFRLDFNGQLTLGDYVFINDNCNINCVNKVVIGNYTRIAPNVCINDHDHNYKNTNDYHLIKGEVIIGSNVWIGANVVILKDTVIGDNAVIAAGSVVKGKVPANTLFLNKRENKYINYGEPKDNLEKVNLVR